MNVVLLGDSIFESKAYVGDGPDVTRNSARRCSSGRSDACRARRLDYLGYRGSSSAMPKDATHLVVSSAATTRRKRRGRRGKGALGRRGAGQAREDQVRLQQELRRDARRRTARRICSTGNPHDYEAHGQFPNRRRACDRSATGLTCGFKRSDSARGVRARAAGDRSQADRAMRMPTTPTTSSLRSRAGRRSARAISTLVDHP